MTALAETRPEPNFAELVFCETGLIADPRGCLYWPSENLLVVSDLHLEKGSSFAARKGMMIPPYDTRQTLLALSACINYWRPKTVISLGDSFHDGDASSRLPEDERQTIRNLMKGREWIWIFGNHDPDPPQELGGMFSAHLQIGPLNFIHEPLATFQTGEIAGHLHPAAKIRRRGKSVRRRCFVGDGTRMIMPAFGAFTGGLNVRDDAYSNLFDQTSLRAWLLSKTEVYEIPGKYLIA